MTHRRVHVVVSGRVQGVFYRDTLCRRANELGVSGWVRNTADGRVEAVFEGDDAAVTNAIGYAREGPPFARVSDIELVEEPATGEHGRFEIRH